MKQNFKLQDVLPNPFRDLERFPLIPDKIESLIESFRATGVWENIEGRLVNGKLQIAYGHHRLAAMRTFYAGEPDKEFNFTVLDLSDSDMIQRMARENKKVYGSDLGTVIESVLATVKAFAEGTVKLSEVSVKTNQEHIRYAPSFHCRGKGGTNPLRTRRKREPLT